MRQWTRSVAVTKECAWGVALAMIVLALLLFTIHNAEAHTLTVNVSDSVTGEPLAARGYCIESADSTAHYPSPASSCYFHPAHATYRWPSWWYLDGSCEIEVAGNIILGVGCGFEYRAQTDTLNITADTTVNFALVPLTDMSSLRWYSGDTGSDLGHPPSEYEVDETDALFVCRAEGMNVMNCETGGSEFTGTPLVDGDRIAYTTYEMRHRRYGHFAPLGARSAPDSVDYITSLAPCIYDIADTVLARDADALHVTCHPSEYQPSFRNVDTSAGHMWPREVVVDVYYDKVDAYDIMWLEGGYTPTRYKHMLSAGGSLPCTGGTDSALNRLASGPPGGMKTYVYVADEYNYRNWIEAIRDGHTFATNGPIITEFTVDGAIPGETLEFTNIAPETLDVVFSFESGYPVTCVDYLVNGTRTGGKIFSTASTAWDTTDTIVVQHGGAWISVEVTGVDPGWFVMGGGQDSLAALTSPVYVEMAGLAANVPASAEWCSGWVDSLISYVGWQDAATWSSAVESTRVLALFEAAGDGYDTKAAQTVYTVGSGGDYANLYQAFDSSTGCDPFDTIIMLDGTHTGGGGRAVPNGVTIRSLGPDHKADCIIRNISATAQGVYVDSLAYIYDVTFRTNLPITGTGDAVLHVEGAAAELYLYNSDFRNCVATERHGAFFANVVEGVYFEDVVFDSCRSTTAGTDYGAAYIRQVQNFTWTGGRITNCSSPDRAPILVATEVAVETLEWDNILIEGNSSANYGIVWFTGGQAGDVFYLDHITVADNACTDNADGALVLEGANLFSLKHSIISGGGSLVAFKSTAAPDTMHYCDLYGNGANVAYGDTLGIIKVDPEYSTTDLAHPYPYMAMSVKPVSGTSNPRATADGSYMGWLDPPPVPVRGSGLMGRLYRRRR